MPNRHKDKSPGERLRLALESLGPVWIKLGQMLSTRRDLLPADIANELAMLQDKVKAFPGEQAQQLIEQALGVRDIAEVFADFSVQPLASASIAQVHTATLKSGPDRKSTRLNSSHVRISYAVFCLKKKKLNNKIS